MRLPSTLTGMASTLRRLEPDHPRARWSLWKHRKHLALWQGVCLTMDVEPTEAILKAHRWPEWLKDRLGFLEPFLRDKDTFSQTILGDAGGELHRLVTMREFACLALKLWPDELPQELSTLAGGGAGQDAQADGKPQKQPKANPIDPTSRVQQDQERKKRFKDHLAKLIHDEQRRCKAEGGDPMDKHTMFARLVTLSNLPDTKRPYPLISCGGREIIWNKDGDTTTLDVLALGKRLKPL